jgi:hypothetical protein
MASAHRESAPADDGDPFGFEKKTKIQTRQEENE